MPYSNEDKKNAKTIKSRYVTPPESKLERLYRLDKQVRQAGLVKAVVEVLIGMLMLGIGICFHVNLLPYHLGVAIVLYIFGAFTILSAYPTYCLAQKKAKRKFQNEIIKLAEQVEKE